MRKRWGGPLLLLWIVGCSDNSVTADGGNDATSNDAPSEAATTGCGAALPTLPLDEQRQLLLDAGARSYWIHVPASYTGSPTALVLDFHGDTPQQYGDPALFQRTISKLVAKSDAAGFIVVEPVGLANPDGTASWNGGSCCATNKTRDDVGFVRAMVDAISGSLCVDPKRVYAAGYSSGAFMAYRLACEASDRIAAVSPVSVASGVTTCNPSWPVSVVDVAGTEDPFMAYATISGTTSPGWAARDHCADASTQTFQNGDSTCDTWAGCGQNGEVTLCTVDGGGHTWPGGLVLDDAGAGVGHTTLDIIADDALWDFFQKHPMP